MRTWTADSNELDHRPAENPIVSQPCVLDRHPDCLEPHICGCDCHRAPAARPGAALGGVASGFLRALDRLITVCKRHPGIGFGTTCPHCGVVFAASSADDLAVLIADHDLHDCPTHSPAAATAPGAAGPANVSGGPTGPGANPPAPGPVVGADPATERTHTP